MPRPTRRAAAAALAAALALPLAGPVADAAPANVIDVKVSNALETLFATVPGAEELFPEARGVLVMPDIVKGGFVVGGAYGEGALLIGGETVDYYSFAAASIGFQAGVQSTAQALYFMTDKALADFRAAKGWELGGAAGVAIPGKGVNVGLDSTTAKSPIIVFAFGADGLMAGVSVEGGKYTRIER